MEVKACEILLYSLSLKPPHYRDLVLRMEQGHEDTMMGYLPGDCVLHHDAVSDCSYRTFDNDGDANSLVSVSLSGFSGLVYILYYMSMVTGGCCGSDV